MRSHTGCETCRQRKLKCDERKPVCNRCSRAGRGCVQGSIFRHQDGSVTVNTPPNIEHHQPPTSTGVVNAEESGFKKFTFVYVNDPYSDDTIVTESPTAHTAKTPHSIISVQDDFHEQLLPSPSSDPDPDQSVTPIGEPALRPQVILHQEPNEAGQHEPLITVNQQADSSAATPRVGPASETPFHQIQEVQLGRAQSLSADPVLSIQLIWYFKEAPGKWMDLFDVTAYFTFYVPRLAATKPLLRSACCALASKHICRLLDSRHSTPNSPLSHLDSDYWKANLRNKNWGYESAAYYDDAIRLLMDEITRISDLTQTSLDRNYRSEEALAAIAILCVYELLDAPGPEWTAHMSALPLLETAPAQILDTLSPQPLPRRPSKRSIFWNFVRQDYLYAFIHETCTRLNPDDPQFWRESGLLVGDNGFLQPDYAVDTRSEICLTIDEDLVSHALFWILSRIVNFMAAMVSFDPVKLNTSPRLPSSSGLSHDEIASQWERLSLEIQSWKVSLPPPFSSCVRTRVFNRTYYVSVRRF